MVLVCGQLRLSLQKSTLDNEVPSKLFLSAYCCLLKSSVHVYSIQFPSQRSCVMQLVGS